MTLSGFGNHFSSEAIPGALPIGRNSPQRPAFGLYAEQLSGTAFTMARSENRRSWLYRLRPSARHGAFTPLSVAENLNKIPANPNRLRWNPRAIPTQPTRFIASITPMLVNGDPETLSGVTLSTYAFTENAANEVFFRRWRAVVHSRTGRADTFYRIRPARYRPPTDRDHPARGAAARRNPG